MNNLNGFQRFYYKDGSLQLLIPYVNGRIHGKVYYYTNDLCLDGSSVNKSVSKIKQISNYKKNMLTGPSIFFYESGKIKTRRFYVNNRKSGYYREYFENAGGKNYLYIPCLNTNPMHIDMMSTIIEKHTQGWSV